MCEGNLQGFEWQVATVPQENAKDKELSCK